MLHAWYRTAHGLYMVFSITNRESFIELDHYMTVALQAKESENFPVIIAGWVLLHNFPAVLKFPYLVISAIWSHSGKYREKRRNNTLKNAVRSILKQGKSPLHKIIFSEF
jgi:hypothetical protein